MFSRCHIPTKCLSSMLMALAISACGQIESQSADSSLGLGQNAQEAGGACTSNAQCSGANPICDVLITHKCQPCTLNLECILKNGNYPLCQAGSCGGCASNAQCSGTTPICNGFTKQCVPGTCPGIGADINLLGLNLTASVGEAHTGDTRVYACINDTIAVGVTVSTCQSDGTWSNPPPNCVPREGTCANDAACASNQWCRFSGSETSGQCTAKVANGGSLPIDPRHPGATLDGTCGEGVGESVCASGVCDSDNKCGFANGGGTCQASSSDGVCRGGVCGADAKCGHPNGEGTCNVLNASTVCRSTICSLLGGICVPFAGCGSDLDCAAVQWCNTQTFTCTPRVPNGESIPTVANHNPPLTGACSSAVGASVCYSGVCDSDGKCGYPNGGGTCNILTAGMCRSGVCDALIGKCTAAPGCTTDLQCDITSQYCDTGTGACAPKVPNGGDIPTTPGHSPELNGTCSVTVGASVCQSGVCSDDGKCGIKNGSPLCTVLTANVCRSGTCSSVIGVCIPSGGCVSDLECSADQFCDTSVYACAPKKKNGEDIPTTPGHIPPLEGECNALTAVSVCSSGVCDADDHKCGYQNDNGPCTKANGSGVCRSGYCGDNGSCEEAPNCVQDSDCASDSFCGGTKCRPKVPNGGDMPTYPNHDPELNGVCTEAAAAKVCVSGVCDTQDNKCGYLIARGPCDADNGATVCRSSVCDSDTHVCVECNDDSECGGSTGACDTITHTCKQCTATSQFDCGGSTPVCDVSSGSCAPCGGDYGSRAANSCRFTDAPYCSNRGEQAGQCGRCARNSDCAGHPTGEVCDTGTGACLPGCSTSADCFAGWTCSADNACVPPTDGPGEPTDPTDPTNPGEEPAAGNDGDLQAAGLVPAGAGCAATHADFSMAALVVMVGVARIVTRKRK